MRWNRTILLAAALVATLAVTTAPSAQAADRLTDIAGDAHGVQGIRAVSFNDGTSVTTPDIAVEPISDDSLDVLSGDVTYVAASDALRFTVTLMDASAGVRRADVSWSFIYSEDGTTSCCEARFQSVDVAVRDVFGAATPDVSRPVSGSARGPEPGFTFPAEGWCGGCTAALDRTASTLLLDIPVDTLNAWIFFGADAPIGPGSSILDLGIFTSRHLDDVDQGTGVRTNLPIDKAKLYGSSTI